MLLTLRLSAQESTMKWILLLLSLSCMLELGSCLTGNEVCRSRSPKCPTKRVCRGRGDYKRCRCKFYCSAFSRKLGPVCGTDGQTYRSLCKLRKTACSAGDNSTRMSHFGDCQGSVSACKHQCPGKQQCRGKNGVFRCTCRLQCSWFLKELKPVCGSDGRTYRNVCQLKRSSCRSVGTEILIDHYGFCQETPTFKEMVNSVQSLNQNEVSTKSPPCQKPSHNPQQDRLAFELPPHLRGNAIATLIRQKAREYAEHSRCLRQKASEERLNIVS